MKQVEKRAWQKEAKSAREEIMFVKVQNKRTHSRWDVFVLLLPRIVCQLQSERFYNPSALQEASPTPTLKLVICFPHFRVLLRDQPGALHLHRKPTHTYRHIQTRALIVRSETRWNSNCKARGAPAATSQARIQPHHYKQLSCWRGASGCAVPSFQISWRCYHW